MRKSTPHRRIVVLGATGTTGRRTLAALRARGHEAVGVSRSTATRFDWADAATWDPVLSGAAAVYVLPPVGVLDSEEMMRSFVDRALEHGVQRVVLLSAALIEEGMAGLGQVHAHVRANAPEWTVLRPSWFMQNFEDDHYMAEDVRADGRLRTSIGDGRVAFVDAEDIAAVAARALSDDEPHQTDHVLTGPESLSYDSVATILSRVSGRRVVHDRVDAKAVRDRLIVSGLDAHFAEMLAGLETYLRDGADDRVSPAVERVTGRPPRSFSSWAAAHADVWR